MLCSVVLFLLPCRSSLASYHCAASNTHIPLSLLMLQMPDKHWPRCQSLSTSCSAAPGLGVGLAKSLALRQGPLLAPPQELPVCQERGWRAHRTSVCSTLAMPMALRGLKPKPSGPDFCSGECSCSTQSRALCLTPREATGHGGCHGCRKGTHCLSGVHTGAAVFCGCQLWLRFSVCNPSG